MTTKAEQKALKAVNRIHRLKPAKQPRRFWICECGYKTIAQRSQKCRDCDTAMTPDRLI